MKRKSFIPLSGLLFISIAVLTGWLLIGNPQPVAAASIQTGDLINLEMADVSAYRFILVEPGFWSRQVPSISLQAAGNEFASQRAIQAWYARNQGIADLQSAGIELASQRAIEAWYARNQGLAEFNLSGGNTAAELLSLGNNPQGLDIYHQSEWNTGRVLPIYYSPPGH
jgi:hypothetical protein